MQSPSPRYKHPSCLPLRLNETDTYYKDVTCINYVRSALGVSSQCKFGAAQQVCNLFTYSLVIVFEIISIEINHSAIDRDIDARSKVLMLIYLLDYLKDLFCCFNEHLLFSH